MSHPNDGVGFSYAAPSSTVILRGRLSFAREGHRHEGSMHLAAPVEGHGFSGQIMANAPRIARMERALCDHQRNLLNRTASILWHYLALRSRSNHGESSPSSISKVSCRTAVKLPIVVWE